MTNNNNQTKKNKEHHSTKRKRQPHPHPKHVSASEPPHTNHPTNNKHTTVTTSPPPSIQSNNPQSHTTQPNTSPHKTPNPSNVTSPVPTKYTNHESHTFTQSSQPFPHPTTHSYSSAHHHPTMSRYQNHQHPQHTLFHVGTTNPTKPNRRRNPANIARPTHHHHQPNPRFRPSPPHTNLTQHHAYRTPPVEQPTKTSSSSQLAQPPFSTNPLRKNLQKKTPSPTGEYYGIRCGRDRFSGVATSWNSCSEFVVGYRDAVYQLFDTWDKAERFSDRYGTGASITHRSNFRHFFGGKRNGVMQKPSATRLPWEHENEPQVVSLVIGAAWLRFGIGSGIGGYAVFLSLNNPYNCAGLMEGHVTKLRLQLKGMLEALEIVYQHRLVKDGGTVELYTTSEEVKNGIDHWLDRWDRSGHWVRDGKPVGSQDLWKPILNIRKELLKKGTKIHTIWIRRPHKVPALQHAVSLAQVVFNSEKTNERQQEQEQRLVLE